MSWEDRWFWLTSRPNKFSGRMCILMLWYDITLSGLKKNKAVPWVYVKPCCGWIFYQELGLVITGTLPVFNRTKMFDDRYGEVKINQDQLLGAFSPMRVSSSLSLLFSVSIRISWFLAWWGLMCLLMTSRSSHRALQWVKHTQMWWDAWKNRWCSSVQKNVHSEVFLVQFFIFVSTKKLLLITILKLLNINL